MNLQILKQFSFNSPPQPLRNLISSLFIPFHHFPSVYAPWEVNRYKKKTPKKQSCHALLRWPRTKNKYHSSLEGFPILQIPLFTHSENTVFRLCDFFFQVSSVKEKRSVHIFFYSSDLGGAWLVFPTHKEVCLWAKGQKHWTNRPNEEISGSNTFLTTISLWAKRA